MHRFLIYSFFVFVFLFSSAQNVASAETISNVGFAPSNIWYSHEPFFANEPIRIYTILYNSSDRDIKGDITFFDNDKAIGTVAFSIARGHVHDTWIDWTPEKGDHEVYAILEHVRETLPDGKEVQITLSQAKTGTSKRTIEVDTDKDDIPDSTDQDDDGDGISDSSEIASGTDPKKADTDGDGISDREDVDPLVKNKSTEDKLKDVADSISTEALPAAASVAQTAFKKSEEIRTLLKDTAEENINSIKEEGDPLENGKYAQAAALYGNYSLFYAARYQVLFYGLLILLIIGGGRWLWLRNAGDRF